MFRSLIIFGFVAGSTLGGFVPYLWGDHALMDMPGVLMSFVGGVAGIWAGHRFSQSLDL